MPLDHGSWKSSAMAEPQANLDDLRLLPKVSLHDHLDGGLRPATILEIADAEAYFTGGVSDPRSTDYVEGRFG